MKERGFTLVEVLGVIAILGVILAITVPTMIGVMDRSKQRAYNIQVNSIVDAAKSYVLKNAYRDPTMQDIGVVFEVSLQKLNEAGTIDLPIKNPITDENYDITKIKVKIKKEENGLYDYCFYDPDHEDHLCSDF